MRSRSLWKELKGDEATWFSRSRHEEVSDSVSSRLVRSA